MASMLRAYNAILQRKPMAAQCATAAVLFGAGDVIAQQAIEKKGRNHDVARTLRLSVYGGALFGPIVVKWYQFLNRLQFTSPAKATVYRVFLDQFALSPVLVGFFFTAMPVLEGKPGEISDRLKQHYSPTLLRNWGVFIPVQLLNFAVVPHHLRFVTVSVVSLFWNTYLSAVNARVEKQEDLKVSKLEEGWTV